MLSRIRISTRFLAAALLVTCGLVSACSNGRPPVDKQSAGDDEKLIRELVRKADEGQLIKRTEDSILSSGLTPRPLVGRREQERFREKFAAARKKRPNEKTTTTVERVVVARSGELAYEYSHFRMRWDGPDRKRIGLDGSYLRVWRKVNGKWLEEAYFARPDQEPRGRAEKE
jgi:ketosteroid isomerase-like protein